MGLKRISALVFNIFVPLAIVCYSVLFYRDSFLSVYIIAAAVVIMLAYILTSVFDNRLARVVKTGVFIFSITYVLLELTTYVLLGLGIIRTDMRFYFGGIDATDKKFTRYDTISGFRGIPGKVRYLSIDNGKFEIDHATSINSQGWFSNRDYTYRKTDVRIKRYMVLGDSYSSGLAVSTAWPDIVQDMLSQKGSDSLELYNFSLEGSGIVNWYRIFMYELLPRYDFDGIIIASSSEKSAFPDFDRKFIMMNSYDDATNIAVTDVLGKPIPPVFPKNNAAPVIPIYPNAELDRIKKTYTRDRSRIMHYRAQRPDLWFLAIFYGVTDGFHRMIKLEENSNAYNKPYETYYKLAGQPYKMEYFDERYKYAPMLKEIIAICKKRNKDVVLIGIPDYENAMDYVNKKPVICRQEVQFLSDYYQLKQYDGFEMFNGRNPAFVDSVFYEFDRHWNKAGVRIFAGNLVRSGILETK